MITIRAVVVDPNVAGRLALGDVEAPAPGPAEALVKVAAISLNRGEVRRAQTAEAGWRPGWDIAGVVQAAAADGSGPKAGQRVVGVLPSRAWAEVVAVPTHALAVLPDNVTFEQAATLPIAGLTALYALQRGGLLLGKNVLVTGASGGVGHFAVQMARQSGARVAGLVRQERHSAAVREAGARAVVADETGAGAGAHGPYDLILESVGSTVLTNVLKMLAPGGACVSFGISAGAEATIDASGFYGARATYSGLSVFSEMARETASVGLGRLSNLVADGILRPLIAVEAPWSEIGRVAQGLMDRTYAGKAVLRVSQ